MNMDVKERWGSSHDMYFPKHLFSMETLFLNLASYFSRISYQIRCLYFETQQCVVDFININMLVDFKNIRRDLYS